MRYTLIIIFAALFMKLSGQASQTVRGTAVDSESKYPLIGANVVLVDAGGMEHGAVTEVDGSFRLEGIALGRSTITFSYIGYAELKLDNIIIDAGKEMILNVEMEESATTLDEVVVSAAKSGEVVNEMAVVSAREFSVEETNRYAGSRGEPARMASNFAGVQGADDSRNDIIVRGNTPQGVLWRLDGFNIPNPNHFSIPGTGGGPVTILNNKFLANSDFFTGAFPAEYANGIAGVFDLKMRNGNNEKHEVSAQLGFLGTELAVEGPLSKNSKASYLATYRYSTLSLFSFLGINLGTDAVPQYQDGSFRLNFPGKNGSAFSIFGIGGTSTIDIILSQEAAPDTTTLIYGSNNRDQYFTSNMYTVGATYTYPIDKNTFFKAGLMHAGSKIIAKHDYIYRRVENGLYKVDSLPQILDYTFDEKKYSMYGYVNKKLSRQTSLKAGINVDLFDMNFFDRGRTIVPAENPDEPASLLPWIERWNSADFAGLVQPYIQAKYRPNEQLTITGGITASYYSINDKSLVPFEPRLGLSYQVNEISKLSFGLGAHSQMQSNYLYYYKPTTDVQPYNVETMGPTKSKHAVLSYDAVLNKKMRLKAETYFQYLSDVPVELVSSAFALINSGSGFSRLFPRPLQNTGDGRNYGVELTLERFFANNYYFMLTSSLYDSKYRGSNEEWHNTTFNGNYTFNGLFAREFPIKKKNSFNVGGKITYAGGRRYGDVDRDASARELEVIYADNSNFNEYQFKPYFRADLKLNYKINRKSLTHEFAVDIVNLLDTKNILTLTYDPENLSEPVREEYQLGRLPLFYYRIDF